MAADGRGSSGRRGPPTGNTYSTTAGRQRLPGILQTVYGDKSVAGLERYGLLLGAIVPPEAVLLLAGQPQRVDDDVRERITRAAVALIAQLPER